MTMTKRAIALGASLILALALSGCGGGGATADPTDSATSQAPPTSAPAEPSAAQTPDAGQTTQQAPPAGAEEVTTEPQGEGPIRVDAGAMIISVPEGAQYKVDRGYYVDGNAFVEMEVKDLPRTCAFSINRTRHAELGAFTQDWLDTYAANFTDEFINKGEETYGDKPYSVIFQKGNVKRLWFLGTDPVQMQGYAASIKIYCDADADGNPVAGAETITALLNSITYVDAQAELID